MLFDCWCSRCHSEQTRSEPRLYCFLWDNVAGRLCLCTRDPGSLYKLHWICIYSSSNYFPFFTMAWLDFCSTGWEFCTVTLCILRTRKKHPFAAVVSTNTNRVIQGDQQAEVTRERNKPINLFVFCTLCIHFSLLNQLPSFTCASQTQGIVQPGNRCICWSCFHRDWRTMWVLWVGTPCSKSHYQYGGPGGIMYVNVCPLNPS